MKYLLIALALSMSACSTVVVKKWSYPKGGEAGFDQAAIECRARAKAMPYEDQIFDICLQRAGYTLDVSKQSEWIWQ